MFPQHEYLHLDLNRWTTVYMCLLLFQIHDQRSFSNVLAYNIQYSMSISLLWMSYRYWKKRKHETRTYLRTSNSSQNTQKYGLFTSKYCFYVLDFSWFVAHCDTTCYDITSRIFYLACWVSACWFWLLS